MLNTSRNVTTKSAARREAPRWLIITIAIFGVAVLGYFGFQALMGHDGEPGPRVKVHPGMYDLRAEVGKMRAAHQVGGTSDGR